MTLISRQYSVFPSIAVAHCTISTLDRQNELTVNELRILSLRPTEKLKISFLAGRLAAHEALRAVGKTEEVLALASSTQLTPPLWPSGCTGSISHTFVSKNKCIAVSAVSPLEPLIGIDIEPGKRVVQPQLIDKITSDPEREALGLSLDNQTILEIFSVKEALYKALWPKVQQSLSFTEACIDRDTSSIQLSPSLLAKHPILSPYRFAYVSVHYNDTLITLVSTSTM